ncbi:hypothetical protein [Evansella clarkii]|uniref:hypothetical protein n=1 Tax=Evansella clarkii TaxID=79879 RepID=UPI00099656CC|nr:hypothetical protein [Evansella clarkii]
MIEYMKNNRSLLISVVGGAVMFVLVGFSLWSQISEKKELEEKQASLANELHAVEMNIAERQADLDVEKKSTIKKATGLDPDLIQIDTEAAKAYFEPAFNWKSGSDYDEARKRYIESLGEDNLFTETYLPPDTKVETEDDLISYIDFKNIKASMGDIFVVPMTAEGDRIRYVAFVHYFMHQTNNDLVNTEALERSQAIIEFTAAGSEGERWVTEVTARAGFHSNSE